MLIKTFKVKHHKKDFENMFQKAYEVALYAKSQQGIKTPTSKDVKGIGLKSEISNQILRKYHSNKTLKTIKKDKVKLTIPGQNLKLSKENKNIYISCLKLTLNCWFDFNFLKVNQIEIDKEYAYISCSFQEETENKETKRFIGIDLNSTSHSIVIANQATGKVKKYGKSIPHVQKKYKEIRKNLQQKNCHSPIKKLGNRAKNIVNDTLHKATTAIVKEAKATGCGIKIENLKGIAKKNTKKYYKENNFTLNSWPFYKFKQLIEYKAFLSGVSVIEIDPSWTSQNCSRCGLKGNRERKLFKCSNCGHVDHADVNAAFNIAFSGLVNPIKNEIGRRGEKAKASPLPMTPSTGNGFESNPTREHLGEIQETHHFQ